MVNKKLAMAPVIFRPSKEPDGMAKVSVKILFLDRGVHTPPFPPRSSLFLSLSRSFIYISLSSLFFSPFQSCVLLAHVTGTLLENQQYSSEWRL